jgi:hypothetical protein
MFYFCLKQATDCWKFPRQSWLCLECYDKDFLDLLQVSGNCKVILIVTTFGLHDLFNELGCPDIVPHERITLSVSYQYTFCDQTSVMELVPRLRMRGAISPLRHTSS